LTTKILWAWVLTIPISAVVGSLCYLALSGVLGA
jgi:phosphate/sulfate permease